MKTTKNYKFWFATGSQDLYGDECLQKVAEHSKIIVNELNKSGIPVSSPKTCGIRNAKNKMMAIAKKTSAAIPQYRKIFL